MLTTAHAPGAGPFQAWACAKRRWLVSEAPRRRLARHPAHNAGVQAGLGGGLPPAPLSPIRVPARVPSALSQTTARCFPVLGLPVAQRLGCVYSPSCPTPSRRPWTLGPPPLSAPYPELRSGTDAGSCPSYGQGRSRAAAGESGGGSVRAYVCRCVRVRGGEGQVMGA